MHFQLTPRQTDRFIEWRDKQATKGRYPHGPRFAFVFQPTHSHMLIKVIDKATSEELELTEEKST